MSEEQYHADPAATPSLSSGVASLILNGTLAEARMAHPRLNPAYEPEDRTQFDLGSVAHRLLLGAGADIVPIDAADWRTKAAQEARANALKDGKQACLLSVYETAQVMVERARDQLASDPDNRDAFGAHGVSESVAIAQFDVASGPATCRAMADWRDPNSNAIFDYKTFKPGADPDGFARYLFREARDIQDPFYSLVFGGALAVPAREIQFRFVLQSPVEPYLLSVVELDEQAREFAFERAAWAINKWAEAMRNRRFPGYPPRTHYVAAPNYELHRWSEKMAAEDFAAQLDARAAHQAEE